MRRTVLSFSAYLMTIAGCSDADERALDAAATMDASLDASDAASSLDADAESRDAASNLDADASSWRFCNTGDLAVNMAVVRQLPEPLTSQCERYRTSPPAQPSKGPLLLHGGMLDFDSLPDFVAIDGIAPGGYASKLSVLCSGCDQTYGVFDESLRTQIGVVLPHGGYRAF